MAGGIQHNQATLFICRHEPEKILTVLERRKLESTTETPNRMDRSLRAALQKAGVRVDGRDVDRHSDHWCNITGQVVVRI